MPPPPPKAPTGIGLAQPKTARNLLDIYNSSAHYCTICDEPTSVLSELLLLPCAHCLHYACVPTEMKTAKKRECPQCGAAVKKILDVYRLWRKQFDGGEKEVEKEEREERAAAVEKLEEEEEEEKKKKLQLGDKLERGLREQKFDLGDVLDTDMDMVDLV